MLIRLALSAIILVVCATATPVVLSSNFDGGTTEGWTVTTWGPTLPGGGTGPVVVPSGGVGDTQYLQTEDTANGFLYFMAPTSWVGDFSPTPSYTYLMRFYLQNKNPNTYRNIGYLGDAVVRISGSGGPDIYYFNAPGANLEWTLNEIPLDPNSPNWKLGPYGYSTVATAAEVASTLASVTSIGILADWVVGYYGKPGIDYGHDITGLDGVTIVPEPGTYLLAGAGLLVVMWKRRRK